VVLSGDLIVAEAIRLSRLHGPEGLSARRLGAALGCDPTALYRYFASTDDLLLAVCGRLIGEAMAGFTPGESWIEGLREFARRIHASFTGNPRLAMLMAVRVTRRPEEFRAIEAGLSLLLRAGFSPADAVRHYAALADVILAHATLDATVLTLPPEHRAADARAWAEVFAELPPAQYPSLAAVRPELGRMASSSFDHAVDLVLSAIAAQAPRF
jgi:AcrR family transcriptional regulator